MRTGTVIAATVIGAAPEGLEPGYVIALVDIGGCRELVRLDDGSEPPSAGSIVRVGRGDRAFPSGRVVSGAGAAH